MQLDDPRLQRLCSWHQRWRVKQTRTTEKPSIDATIGDFPTATELAWQAITRDNEPPFLFRRGGLPVRIEDDERGMPVIRELSVDGLRHDLANAANYFKPGELGVSPTAARPPKDVCVNMLAGARMPLPGLARLVTAPIFTADGRLLRTSGYDRGSRILVDLGGLAVPPIPSHPTEADVTAAKSVLLELITDFPFASDTDHTNACGLFVLPFARELIAGLTPLHLFDAPEMRSGKGLLAKVLLFPFLGVKASVISEAKDDEEWRKKITAALRTDHPYLFLDNLSHYLDSPALAAVLTTQSWCDRLLGHNDLLTLPVRVVFVATGNNVSLSLELARCTIPIRLNRESSAWREFIAVWWQDFRSRDALQKKTDVVINGYQIVPAAPHRQAAQ